MGRSQGRKGGGGMGAYRAGKEGNKKDRSGEKRGRDDTWHMDQRNQTELGNDTFERFYRAQVFNQELDGAVWDNCYASFKVPLPMATRVNRNHPDRKKIANLLFNEFKASGFTYDRTAEPATIAEAAAADFNTPAPILRSLPFIPEGLGMQVPLSRSDIKRGAENKRLKRILASFNEAGLLTRQETVSMVPPMMLDVKPGMRVLDMCAAPGSKTSQLLEALVSGGYNNSSSSSNASSSLGMDNYDVSKSQGVVVANDVNIARIDVLTHQTGRAPHSHPNLIITNNDATNYPLIVKPEDKFDRVLCDVMCSGDGTLRKSLDLWARWSPLQGGDLHPSQLRTLLRGMSLVKAGGIVVYSTCSLNPVEDEAVIAEALLQAKGAFELVDPTELPAEEGGEESIFDSCIPAPANSGTFRVCKRNATGLRYSPGVTTWQLSNKEGDKFFDNYESAAEYRRDVLKEKGFNWRPTMFPPKVDSEEHAEAFKAVAESLGESTPSIASLHLERSMRILPHLQDTGGFFVAALRCKKDFCAQESNTTRRLRQQEELRGAEASASAVRTNLPYVPIAGSSIEKCLATTLNLDSSIFPFNRVLIRREGFAQLTGAPYGGADAAADAATGYDSDGNAVTAGRPPRIAKLFLATQEAMDMMSKFSDIVKVKQIGIKVFETYSKHSNDKFRFFAESLDTMVPYLMQQQRIQQARGDGAATKRSFLVRIPNAESLEWMINSFEKSNGRSTLNDFLSRVEVMEASADANDATGFTLKKVTNGVEWKQTVARKSFAVMCPLYNNAIAEDAPQSQKDLQSTLSTFSPIAVSAELDDAMAYIQVKILPHHITMFRLALNGSADDPNAPKKEEQKAEAGADVPANPKSRERDDDEEAEAEATA